MLPFSILLIAIASLGFFFCAAFCTPSAGIPVGGKAPKM